MVESDSEPAVSGERSNDEPYDLVVIGGGINGAGIARDAALRDLKVLLLEARDFGSGTSSWSTRLIHGGLRYLEHAEIHLVRESLHERMRLRKNADHLVKPLCITIPIYKGGKRGRFLVRLGMILYDFLSLGKSMPRHRMLTKDELLQHEPGIDADGLLGGAQYFDAQVTYAERLVLENVIAASENGARVLNYSPVTGFQCHEDGIHHVRFNDRLGREQLVGARVIVNASGPWVDQVLSLGDETVPRLMGGTKGSHIVVGEFAGAPESAIYVEASADGRPIFIVPWNGQYLIGTTDIRVDGDPSESRASDDEIAYLIDEANRVFPGAALSAEDVHFAYAGVRPLPFKEKGPESAITRRHIIKVHRGGLRGLISIIGGKLTTFRSLAEQTVDRLGRFLNRKIDDCATRDSSLPGALNLAEAKTATSALDGLSDAGRRRVVDIYGSRVQRLVELAASEADLGNPLDADGTVLAAEVALAVRDEFAWCLSDIVHRRLMIGLSADLGAHITLAVASIAARELDWDSEEAERQLSELNAHNARLRRTA